ncbi:MAG TPA: NADH-quinone oxidoreductase subunit A, partial [Cytophagales bacterium]|nr:NADH-quinone oxidoreductase subunit A [Cytophagales bacterium]
MEKEYLPIDYLPILLQFIFAAGVLGLTLWVTHLS